MLGAIASALGAHYEETLTGFKWIAHRARALGREGKCFVFGYEEALGYMVGDLVLDKDGISSAVLFADLAAVCRARGVSVLGYLEELSRQYGFYASAQRSLTFPAGSGTAPARAFMRALRNQPPERMGGRAVLARRDYALPAAEHGGPATLPPSDVLAYDLEGDTRVVVRPSGTEPKLKCYLDHRELVGPGEPAAAAEMRARREMDRIGENLMAMLAP